MATIALNGSSLNCSTGIGYYIDLNSSFSRSKSSTKSLSDAFTSLKQKIDIVQVAADISTSGAEASAAKKREGIKVSSLTLAYEKLDQLIVDTGNIDHKVSGKISSREDDFYKRYSYLKPDCKKTKKELRDEKWAERWQNFKNFWDGVGNAISNIAHNAIDFCKENWKEILKVLTVAILVITSVLLLVFVPGGGLLSAILLGAAKGCIVGLISSVAINGLVNKICGKMFFDGALDAAFTGSVGGFIGGAITGGLVGNAASMTKSASQGLLKVGTSMSFRGAIVRGAFAGATSTSISNASATALRYLIDNGSLKGASKEIAISAFSGLLSGGLIGGVGGGFQYKIQNPSPINPKAYEYELKALMEQGIPENEATELIEQFQQGINPGGKFAFHFTTLDGGQGITDSGVINMTQNGFRGQGVYAGTSPMPSWEVKHIPYIGWGLGKAPVRIPIVLDGLPVKQVKLPAFATVIQSVVEFAAK